MKRHLIHIDAAGQVWVFTWTEESINRMIGRICAYAADPQYTFTEYDAAQCCKHVRQIDWRAKHGQQSI